MDNRAEIREFLTTRRGKVSPARAGLPDVGARRVPGLRRAEVAVLAGVSAEYYAKIERGALAGVSPSVLDALGRALQLDEAEREHLSALARAAAGTTRPVASHGQAPSRRWRPHLGLQWALDAVTGGPAIVRNGRMDLLATNLLGEAMHSPLYDSAAACAGGPPNFARYTFLDEDSRAFYPDWDTAARTAVAILRTEAGRAPHDKAMHDLVGQLSTCSTDFAALWSAHDVRLHGTGAKTFHHHAVGDLELTYESMDMLSGPHLTMTIYAAEPASPTAQALTLLATWAATRRGELDAEARTAVSTEPAAGPSD